ncbi:hypothetical protein ACM66B_003720 [Microbotryomycetes sp. NB124-2]
MRAGKKSTLAVLTPTQTHETHLCQTKASMTPKGPSLYDNPIPFSLLCELVTAVSNVKPRPIGASKHALSSETSSLRHEWVHKWIRTRKEQHGRDSGRGPLPAGTIVIFMRLFHPEESVRRRYDMQETLLGAALEEYFSAPRGTFSTWNALSSGSSARTSGCLGIEVGRWMKRHARGPRTTNELTLGRVDELLDELASRSSFSAKSVFLGLQRTTRRSLGCILADLLDPLTPRQVSILTQILLRDLHPILYPLPTQQGEVALQRYNTTAHEVIELYHTMREWHEDMPAYYRVCSDLDLAALAVEDAIRFNGELEPPKPQIGVPIEVPKTRKPGVCYRACKHLDGSVAVETKYDGERLQVHVDLSKPSHQQIQIFSKSKRDSTEVRIRMLPIVRAALGVRAESYDRHLQPLLIERLESTENETPFSCPTRIILEGEMVPFNEDERRIDEFWKLPFAKSSAEDIDHRVLSPNSPRSSVLTGHTDSQEEEEADPLARLRSYQVGQGTSFHLMAVWFDVLLIDDESLLKVPYAERRARLTSLIRPIFGFSQLAHADFINFRRREPALQALREVYARTIAMRGEGIMIKPLLSFYNDLRPEMRWIKLKKDFIPGAGDTLDVHIIGASWQKQRGRQLLVPPSMFTTFFVGFRADELGADLGRTRKPHYHVLFSSSYGLNRDQLSRLNHLVRSSDKQVFSTDPRQCTIFQTCGRPRSRFRVYDSACTSFTFSLAPDLWSAAARPRIIFNEPRVFELVGAGFQKSASSSYYELRWPRITKVDRTDGEPLDLAGLQRVAVKAMRTSSTDESDLVDNLWTTGTELPRPSGGFEADVEKEREFWLRKLEDADGVHQAATDDEQGKTGALADGGHRRQTFEPTCLRLGATKTDEVRTILSPPTSSNTNMIGPVEEQSGSSPMTTRQTSLPLARSFVDSCSLTAPPLERKRRRLTLPASAVSRSWQSFSQATSSDAINISTSSPPSSSPSSSSSTSGLPLVSEDCFWSILSLQDLSAPERTRHVHLRKDNFLVNALDVFWCAGWIPRDRKRAFPGKLRQGYIFVDRGDEDVEWLRKRCGTLAREGVKQVVWIVERSALQTVGQWAVGKEMLSVF